MTEELLCPVKDGLSVTCHRGYSAKLLVEVEAGLGTQEGGVVHGPLHEELVLQVLSVQMARDQRFQTVSVFR